MLVPLRVSFQNFPRAPRPFYMGINRGESLALETDFMDFLTVKDHYLVSIPEGSALKRGSKIFCSSSFR